VRLGVPVVTSPVIVEYVSLLNVNTTDPLMSKVTYRMQARALNEALSVAWPMYNALLLLSVNVLAIVPVFSVVPLMLMEYELPFFCKRKM